jgi:hypothetical protein
MNVAEELLEVLSDSHRYINIPKRDVNTNVSDIKCLWIGYEECYDENYDKLYRQTFNLKIGWTEQELQQLWYDLDFEYDEGYGGQELFGIVWFNDGSWLERWEYDGSEGWAYKTTPKIPDNLNQI